MAEVRDILFNKLPQNAGDLQALPEAAMSTPFETAALTVVALCSYHSDENACLEMLALLKGPGGALKPTEQLFLKDRLKGAEYLPKSYFAGATPQNDYKPATPYKVHISENAHSYDSEGYAKVFVDCGGADSARPVTLRYAKDGKWYLWEFSSLLTGIRQPEGSNPWA